MDGVDLVCLSLSSHLSEYEENEIINIVDLPALLNFYVYLHLETDAIFLALKGLQSVWTKVTRIALIHKRPQRIEPKQIPLLCCLFIWPLWSFLLMSASLSPAITAVFSQRWMAERTAKVVIHHVCLWRIKAMSVALNLVASKGGLHLLTQSSWATHRESGNLKYFLLISECC